MMVRELTNDVENWLANFSDDVEHILKGAEILLRINRNKVFYSNVVKFPLKYSSRLRYELNKILEHRKKAVLEKANKEQIKSLMKEVEAIDERLNLSGVEAKEIRHGKRPDHDSLPENIRQLWVDNDLIRLKLREAHLHLRLINESNSSCPDSDRFPWAKEIVRLDKLYRKNWFVYDHYGKNADDPNRASAFAVRMINLNKSRFADSRDPELEKKMKYWWSLVICPSEKLSTEMKVLGINEEIGQSI